MTLSRLFLLPLAPLVLGAAAPARHAAAAPGMDLPVVQDEPWRQVRIMQQFSIRISPGAPMPPQALVELEQEEVTPHFEERHIGKCLAVGGIVAVQSARGNRLLLFMRDQRIVSAALEKACRSSEFYSGFYMQRNADGQLCVDRDILQSRSGASCKVKRWKELVEADDRRFP